MTTCIKPNFMSSEISSGKWKGLIYSAYTSGPIARFRTANSRKVLGGAQSVTKIHENFFTKIAITSKPKMIFAHITARWIRTGTANRLRPIPAL